MFSRVVAKKTQFKDFLFLNLNLPHERQHFFLRKQVTIEWKNFLCRFAAKKNEKLIAMQSRKKRNQDRKPTISGNWFIFNYFLKR